MVEETRDGHFWWIPALQPSNSPIISLNSQIQHLKSTVKVHAKGLVFVAGEICSEANHGKRKGAAGDASRQIVLLKIFGRSR